MTEDSGPENPGQPEGRIPQWLREMSVAEVHALLDRIRREIQENHRWMQEHGLRPTHCPGRAPLVRVPSRSPPHCGRSHHARTRPAR
jgi:hypothetical protein